MTHQVHNHSYNHPPCNERLVDGKLVGACLAGAVPTADSTVPASGWTHSMFAFCDCCWSMAKVPAVPASDEAPTADPEHVTVIAWSEGRPYITLVHPGKGEKE